MQYQGQSISGNSNNPIGRLWRRMRPHKRLATAIACVTGLNELGALPEHHFDGSGCDGHVSTVAARPSAPDEPHHDGRCTQRAHPRSQRIIQHVP